MNTIVNKKKNIIVINTVNHNVMFIKYSLTEENDMNIMENMKLKSMLIPLLSPNILVFVNTANPITQTRMNAKRGNPSLIHEISIAILFGYFLIF